jgi:hypothetical protein
MSKIIVSETQYKKIVENQLVSQSKINGLIDKGNITALAFHYMKADEKGKNEILDKAKEHEKGGELLANKIKLRAKDAMKKLDETDKSFNFIPFNLNKYNSGEYHLITKNGDNVKLLTSDLKGEFPILGVVSIGSQTDKLIRYNKNGISDDTKNYFDLVLVKIKKEIRNINNFNPTLTEVFNFPKLKKKENQDETDKIEKFDLTKYNEGVYQVVNKKGEDVNIIYTKLKGKYNIAAVIDISPIKDVVIRVDKNGKADGDYPNWDLVMLKKKDNSDFMSLDEGFFINGHKKYPFDLRKFKTNKYALVTFGDEIPKIIATDLKGEYPIAVVLPYVKQHGNNFIYRAKKDGTTLSTDFRLLLIKDKGDDKFDYPEDSMPKKETDINENFFNNSCYM